MNRPKISVITPTFNASATLAACLESVARQPYPALEHWVIDGDSTDNTLAIIHEYALKYPHIKYIAESDRGIYDAMNKGIARSTGEWLFFLGSDDVLITNLLSEITAGVDFAQFDLVYGKIREVGRRNRTYGNAFTTERITEEMQLSPFIHLFVHHQGAFIRKALFAIFGKYDLRYRIGADVHFFIKVLGSQRVKQIFIDKYITEVGSDGLSANQDDLIISEEFPRLIAKYLNYRIDSKNYYRHFSKYYFYQIANSPLPEMLSGLLGVLRISFITHDWLFYVRNTAHWVKQRYRRNQKSIA